ncbi:uncharacterized protein [Drosophila bipectinata]|uniref:uncharacterized protein n=1 Tax=Drosophila bipectinata TaxID=42026 RepID=UPI0038B30356
MCVMTFGAACSPSAAHHVKTANSKRFQDSDPRAVKAIEDYHYVDDYVDSFATEREAIEVSTRVKEIHAEGGFELCRFSSSSPTVERMLGPSDHAQSIGWGEAEQKILGMRWQPATDDFRFRVKYHKVAIVSDGKRIATKREFLSMVMSTFDPLGFLCCLMVTAKLLLREVWRKRISWDEPLPAEMYNAFMDWRKEMDKVENFRSPRHYFGSGLVKTIEMHVFVDGSQSAFAAVVYWRITYEDGDVHVRFVCAKTKCAPMRTMTIPRLELQAAVLGTRLMDTVSQDHSVPIAEIVLWTDSKTVLRWIGSTHRRYKQFVGNRVAEILESTKVAQWRWLPSADNVADDATRAQRSVDLSEESRWLKGPAFLRRSPSCWPGTAPTDEADAEDEEEMPSEFVLVGTSDTFISLQRFSSYRRLLRTTAWVLRFTRRCRGQRDELENYGLTAAECEAAEDLLRSDNGKNFVGVDRETKRFSEIFEPERIQSELSSKGIEWIFNCPANPSEGGVWERMVQCVKRVLRQTVKEVAPKEHVMESFLIEAENIVNSRPLTHLPVSADQEAPLTPNDLLQREQLAHRIHPAWKQWRVARMLRDRFWKRWVLEYLPTLTRREKWCRREKPIQRGDIVFVCDPAVPRRDWRKAVVEEAFTGTDE